MLNDDNDRHAFIFDYHMKVIRLYLQVLGNGEEKGRVV